MTNPDKYMIDGTNLVVKNVDDSDSGVYTCIATVLETAEELDRLIKVKVKYFLYINLLPFFKYHVFTTFFTGIYCT